MKQRNKKLIIIAGPCAAESETQIQQSIHEAKKRRVDFMRVNLWKPRTKPGFDGTGKEGLHLLEMVAKAGVNPALEVIIPEHVTLAMQTVFSANPNSKLLVWIGSRNQNHFIQQEIARIASTDQRVTLLVKNQPWKNEDHWEGIVEHVLAGGIRKDRLILCDRGFSPDGDNPHGFRNVSDFPMAMRVRAKFHVPMVFDPSHTGGSVENVLKIAKQAADHDFDGLIIEVHPDPANALTDKKQQLTWEQFDELLGQTKVSIRLN